METHTSLQLHITYIYMLTEPLSSTIPEVSCKNVFLKYYSWYSSQSKPVIKKQQISFAMSFSLKKYSKRKWQFPKKAVSLLLSYHVGNQVFEYNVYIPWISWTKIQRKISVQEFLFEWSCRMQGYNLFKRLRHRFFL